LKRLKIHKVDSQPAKHGQPESQRTACNTVKSPRDTENSLEMLSSR
jgi:hypothetical protein